MTLTGPFSGNDEFKIAIMPEIEGKRYQLQITPKSTASPCYAQICLSAESPAVEHSENVKINLGVGNPGLDEPNSYPLCKRTVYLGQPAREQLQATSPK